MLPALFDIPVGGNILNLVATGNLPAPGLEHYRSCILHVVFLVDTQLKCILSSGRYIVVCASQYCTCNHMILDVKNLVIMFRSITCPKLKQ